jgi:protease I
MAERLTGKRIAILVENGFEQVELTSPKKALEGAGARVDVVSPPAWSRAGS